MSQTLGKYKYRNGNKKDKFEIKFKQCWTNMVKRCNKENATFYDKYGGRGIKVCDRWMKFENFYEDMFGKFEKHSKKHGFKNTTIERINNNGNYEQSNCKWATCQEQASNKSNTLKITFNGVSQTINEWARELGIKRSTLSMRYYVYGWSIERMLTT